MPIPVMAIIEQAKVRSDKPEVRVCERCGWRGKGQYGERCPKCRAPQCECQYCKAACEHKRTTVTDRTIDRLMGNVVCADCGKFIRTFDAG